MKRNAILNVAAACAITLAGGCTYHKTVYEKQSTVPPPPPSPSTTVVVSPTTTPVMELAAAQPPPAPEVEDIPVSPGAEYTWTPGYWHWTSSGWVWMHGSYVIRPYRNAEWVPPHYQKKHGEYVWVDGHWK